MPALSAFTGANTYSGGTTISGGALQGDVAGIQGGILNNSAVIFDQASAGTYSGQHERAAAPSPSKVEAR